MIKNKFSLKFNKKSIDNLIVEHNRYNSRPLINMVTSYNNKIQVLHNDTHIDLSLNTPIDLSFNTPIDLSFNTPIDLSFNTPIDLSFNNHIIDTSNNLHITEQTINTTNNVHYKTYKEEFRLFCSNYIKYIKNIELPKIKKKLKYESVLIEFRILPHLEFLIRNTILKLGKDWSHTIVCGNLNYIYMKHLCFTISPNINVIKLDYDNLNQSTYSKLLATTSFWNLFNGFKILIYQEDSIIFKNNINDFLLWDYIGAPWKKTQNDTENCVGNGGFSLRTKDVMIQVINEHNIKDISLNSSTINFMNVSKMTICPEDVYFSKTMQEYKIGKVSDWNSAYNFSTESVLNLDSFGGHNFWLCDINWKERIYKNNIIQFNIPVKVENGFNEHRGGWDTIKNNLENNNLYNARSNYFFYDMLDIEFLFNKGSIINNKWCGIFHCTPITPSYLNFININNIFDNENFIISLKNCLAIITLSPYLSNYFKNKFKELNIQLNVYTLKHPTITKDIPQFNYINFVNNKSKKIIQLGQQLRKVTSIYVLPNIPNYSKIWLTGTKQYNKLTQFLNYEKTMYNIDKNLINFMTVPMIYLTNYDDYDKLLTNNIVFMDLYDAAANNAIVECIIRNTPIIVNKMPGIVDYLGEKYPLYYNTLDEIPTLLTEENIFNAHQYLLNMNKQYLEIEFFTKKLITLLYNLFNN